MIIALLLPLRPDGSAYYATRVSVQCDDCKIKEWETNWACRSKRDYDRCQSCKNRLGFSGMSGKKHSSETKAKFSQSMLGDNNPSKRQSVREKLSAKLKGRKVPWLTGKKRPEHSKFMSEWMKFVWSHDCDQRDKQLSRLKKIRERLQRGHSKFHDKISNEMKLHGITGFESEQIIGKLFVDELHAEKKIIIECQGDFWHANPLKYKSDDIMNFPGRKVKASDVWKRDADRLQTLKTLGYIVIQIWESDWNTNMVAQIEHIKEVLNGK